MSPEMSLPIDRAEDREDQPRPTHEVRITRRGYVEDANGEFSIYASESTAVENGETVREIMDPFGLVEGERIASNDKRVAHWELKGMVGVANLSARLRRLPESRRRKEHRRERQRQAAKARESSGSVCPSCGNTRWIDYEELGVGYECPDCFGSRDG